MSFGMLRTVQELYSVVERYTLTSLDEVVESLGVELPDGAAPRFNIAPLQHALIRVAGSLVMARWGLLPPWRGHGGKRDPHVLHAPLEALDRVPLLRNAFQRQCCLVLADGFFVWQRGGKKPQPVWVHPVPDPARPHARSRVIAFAGLAATHRDDAQPSFAIIVGPTSPSMPAAAAVGPTMPLVLSADDHAAWLSGARARARELLVPTPIRWRAEPVSMWASSIEHDDARCIEPVGNPAQGELF
jgi:putative SOS response-associated peptidase YedK